MTSFPDSRRRVARRVKSQSFEPYDVTKDLNFDDENV